MALGLLAGRYRLEELLGTGGTASVFRAIDMIADDEGDRSVDDDSNTIRYAPIEVDPDTRHTAAYKPLRALPDNRRAVKLLHPDLCRNERQRARFLAEARVMERLPEHPNIVRVLDTGVTDVGGVGQAYLVEELADGMSLSEYLRGTGPLSVSDALTVAEGVLRGLGAAHQQGIVHRDVTPGNVIVRTDAEGVIEPDQVRLVDFGIADAIGQRATIQRGEFVQLSRVGEGLGAGRSGVISKRNAQTGADTAIVADTEPTGSMVVGNAEYMSPEQAQGLGVTESSDLYQVGALIYTMLTAKVPFPRTTAQEALIAQVTAPPPVPSATRIGVPLEVDRLVAKAMAKNPEDRYATADRMRDAVEEASLRLRAGSGPRAEIEADAQGETTTLSDAGGHTAILQRAGIANQATAPPSATGRAGSVQDGSASALNRSRTPLIQRSFWQSPAFWGTLACILIAGLIIWGVISYQNRLPDTIAVPKATTSSPTTAPRQSSVPTQRSSAPTASSTPSSPSPSPTSSSVSPSPSPTLLVAIPSVSGDTQERAVAALQAAGFMLGEVSSVDSAMQPGMVVASNPAEGSMAKPGSKIALHIASGYNTVPDVQGGTVNAAIKALQSQGFNEYQVVWSGSGTQPADVGQFTVSATGQQAGSRQALSTPISLVVTDRNASGGGGQS